MRFSVLMFLPMLAACVSEEIAPTQPIPFEDTCGAGQFETLLGEPAADHDLSTPGRPQRILPPNTIITQDYRPERLNIDLDAAGRITRLWCG